MAKDAFWGGDSWKIEPTGGMTLRDWFAGQAIVGCALRDAGTSFREQIAVDAYKIADAVLAEREK